jgi:ABC-type amino acid transport substrate-binding protein
MKDGVNAEVRNIMRRRTVALILAVSLFCVWGWIGGAGPQAAAQMAGGLKLVNPGFLTVATHGSLPPEIVVGPGDTMGGMDGVLYNAFVKDHGLKLKLFETTFPSMILAVEQGKVDAGEGVFYTAERAKHVYYTLPFYLTRAGIFTLQTFPYAGPASMDGKRVATVIGYVWASYLQKWSASGAALFPDEVTAVQALLNGQVQGYVNGTGGRVDPRMIAHALHPGDFGFPESVLANIAYNIVNCKNPGMAAALDEELTKLHKSGDWLKALKAHGLRAEDLAELKSVPQGCGG